MPKEKLSRRMEKAKAHRKAVGREASLNFRHQNTNPGKNIAYELEDDILILAINMKKDFGLSKSKKSHTNATSQGPYNFDPDDPSRFAIVNIGTRVPVEDRINLDMIREDLEEAEGDESVDELMDFIAGVIPERM